MVLARESCDQMRRETVDLVQTVRNEMQQGVTLVIEDVREQPRISLNGQVRVTVDMSGRFGVLEQTMGELSDSARVRDVLGEPVSEYRSLGRTVITQAQMSMESQGGLSETRCVYCT